MLWRRQIKLFAALPLLVACLAAGPSYATCSNPTGNAADIKYNSAYHTLQFCTGIYWVPFGLTLATGGGGSGCSNPTGAEGAFIYNGGYHTWQFCNGTNWISMSQGPVSGGGGSGCSNPAGQESALIFNGAYGTYQFCNGTSWVAMGGGYIGPGDIAAGATAWYGLRAYSKAVAWSGTQKAINIRRASDNTTTDIYILTTGNLDTATASTFCASTTCYVTEIYDQSGYNGCSSAPCNLSQATATEQPQLVFNCSGSLPCMAFVSGNSQGLTGDNYAVYQPSTISAVAVRTGNFTTGSIYRGFYSTLMGFGASADKVEIYDGSTVVATETDSAWHSLIGVNNGASSAMVVDGAATAGNAGTGNLGGTVGMGCNDTACNSAFLNGDISEAGIWGVAFSSAQQSSMCHNQYTYWGTSTSC